MKQVFVLSDKELQRAILAFVAEKQFPGKDVTLRVDAEGITITRDKTTVELEVTEHG